MNFLEKYNLKTSTILKIAGLAIVAIIVIVFAFTLISASLKSLSGNQTSTGLFKGIPAYDSAMTESAGVSMGLSARNVASAPGKILPPSPEVTTGDNAEEFEVTEYNANIETRQLDQTCAVVTGLKGKDYVIFESASEYDQGCNYVFKVKKANVAEILGVIKGLNPKDLAENTFTIKALVEDFTSEIQILQKKLASVDETLKKAISAYDEVGALATRIQNVEVLTKIINNKIDIIERLTQERININAQLEQIARAKAQQLDRLEYTYFRVNILEDKFIDGENLADSWKAAVKEFVTNINKVIQDITVNLIAFLFVMLQYIIYLFILLFVVKYGWKLIKYIWKK